MHICVTIHTHTYMRIYMYVWRDVIISAKGLFCKRALWKRRYSAKETYDFTCMTWRNHIRPTAQTYLEDINLRCTSSSVPFARTRDRGGGGNDEAEGNAPARGGHCNTLQHTAAHCNTLQHTAAHCSTLQHTATHCNTLQRTATHCNTLQHTATHCNALQHTATHCNRK